MLLLLLSHFSHVQLCATSWMAAHQAPPSLGFSRQEHWSGLPFPSPMHESEKWKWSRSVVSDSLQHHGLQPTRLLHAWDFPGKSTGVGCHCFLHYSPWGGTKGLWPCLITAAAAKSLQLCLTLCDHMDGTPPGSPSLKFSRQEHWSGLPLPSPMHESEKWKWKWSCSVMSNSSRPRGLQPSRLLRPWDFPGKSTGMGCH